MKYTVPLFLFIVVACGCQTSSLPGDYISHTIELKNDLGQLTIMLPSEFDTSYTWDNYTDYRCGDRTLHRVANSHYSLLRESGFFHLEKPDSLYQLTISQPKDPDCFKGERVVDFGLLNQLVEEQLENNRTTQFVIKEIRRIHERDFAIVAYQEIGSDTDVANLTLETFLNDQPISIVFSCNRINCSNFIKRMEPCLETIKIRSPI